MLKTRHVLLVLRRYKTRRATHWSVLEKKKFPSDRALENFDDFYGSVYGLRWKSMRIAMLCERKYMALLNTFGDLEKTAAILESDGAINVRALYENAKANMTETSSETINHQDSNILDSKISKILEQQEDSEITKPYKHVPEATSAEHQEPINQSKSLYKSISEDANFQYDRMIDPDNISALYEFIPTKKLKGMENFLLESDHYRYYKDQIDFPLQFKTDEQLNFPQNLHIYTYDKGNTSTFKAPRRCETGVFSHYLFDGASILPPLALDVKPGDKVLDACAAPGGKSLVLLQTLYPETLICNDLQESRINRLKRVMNDYLYDFNEKWNGSRVILRQSNIILSKEYATYDKILADVPCTTDRHVLSSNENSLFKPSRIKERLKLPETQAAILANCIKLLKPGGTLVFSTCSLSPIQNDGVVHMALSTVFKEDGISVTLHNTSIMTQLLQEVFKFEQQKSLKYGQMVVPFLPANFGPMYFCKMTRN